MKTLKRTLSFAIALIMLMSVMGVTASAATNSDFFHFPLVTKSMGSGYMSAAVAIQKFLLLYSPMSYNLVNSSGGTDGYFGEGSASAASYFQSQEGLSPDGKVGSLTWMKICELLNFHIGADSDASYYWLRNNSGAIIKSNRVILEADGYRSVNKDGYAKEVFYRY